MWSTQRRTTNACLDITISLGGKEWSLPATSPSSFTQSGVKKKAPSCSGCCVDRKSAWNVGQEDPPKQRRTSIDSSGLGGHPFPTRVSPFQLQTTMARQRTFQWEGKREEKSDWRGRKAEMGSEHKEQKKHTQRHKGPHHHSPALAFSSPQDI